MVTNKFQVVSLQGKAVRIGESVPGYLSNEDALELGAYLIVKSGMSRGEVAMRIAEIEG